MATVDLALVLAVDGSASVTYEEFGLIAGGMAAALRDPAVIKGLTGGPAKASYLSLLLWSGAGAHQDVITDWTRVSTAAEVKGFAEQVDNMPRTGAARPYRHRRGAARHPSPCSAASRPRSPAVSST